VTFAPKVEHAVWEIAPGFRALSLAVNRPAGALHKPDVAALALQEAIEAVRTGGPAWAPAHHEAWREVFRRFGAKPQRTPCSAEALRERVLKTGGLPSIDPVVDLYNAISLKYAIPVGGENMAAYQGSPRLVVSAGCEVFDTMKSGAPATEFPDAGEVVWRDDVGVTCRRWNWRQGVRTRLDASQTSMWFVLESLPEMPWTQVEAAAHDLSTGLQTMFDGLSVELTGISQ
jgi:DNA/RNA-binding domain of Phe-tRNA-synthetase-like protein